MLDALEAQDSSSDVFVSGDSAPAPGAVGVRRKSRHLKFILKPEFPQGILRAPDIFGVLFRACFLTLPVPLEPNPEFGNVRLNGIFDRSTYANDRPALGCITFGAHIQLLSRGFLDRKVSRRADKYVPGCRALARRRRYPRLLGGFLLALSRNPYTSLPANGGFPMSLRRAGGSNHAFKLRIPACSTVANAPSGWCGRSVHACVPLDALEMFFEL